MLNLHGHSGVRGDRRGCCHLCYVLRQYVRDVLHRRRSGRQWCLNLDNMRLTRLLVGLERVHDVFRGQTLPGEVSLGATTEAVPGPCLPLARLALLGRVGGVGALLALLASLLVDGLAHLVGTGISLMTWASREGLRGEVLFQNIILRLGNLERVNKRCIFRESFLPKVSRGLDVVRMECGEGFVY